MKIEILDAVYSQTDSKDIIDKFLWLDATRWVNKRHYKVSSKSEDIDLKAKIKQSFETPKECSAVLEVLKKEYPGVIFTIGSWSRKQETHYRKSLVDRKGIFLTGFIPRISKYCDENNIEINIDDKNQEHLITKTPGIKGITFREDQQRLISNAIGYGRGYLIAPTGSGKTVIAGGILSACSNYKCLFLCHTVTLVNQAYGDFKAFGLNSLTVYQGETKDLSGSIVIATMQSFINAPEDRFYDFDVVIIDEVHHLSAFDGTYAKILSKLACPIRIGLTATPPVKQEGKLAVEGFLGPLIDSVSLNEGIQKGILVKPKIKIIKVPPNDQIKQLNNYQEVYVKAIVENKIRNRIIMKTVKEYNAAGKSCLILINRIEHGKELVKTAELLDVTVTFIRGQTDSEIRDEVKQKLKTKEFMCVIATTIWKEGVNIPSLDVIVNAGGGKSEISTLQSLGRGLRTFEGKTEIILIDFFDNSHKFLVDHFGERISLYCDLELL
jgi:superfamily II DNA or RNA helicase